MVYVFILKKWKVIISCSFDVLTVSFCCFHSFDQLKIAASNLKKQATKKNEGSLAYVKGGLSTFFEAQDALSGEGINTFLCAVEVPQMMSD